METARESGGKVTKINGHAKAEPSGFRFESPEEVLSLMETIPLNVIFTGMDFVIRYMNKTSLETLRTLQHLLPMPVDNIVGSSIDAFHKNPAHQRSLLGNSSKLPYNTYITLGEHQLALNVFQVSDHSGKPFGFMASWEIATERLKNEQEVARITSMMENMPINVLMCDLDFNINYMNPKSRETLTKLQKLLPIPVDQVVGSNVDVFHKHPEKQRKLLADDRNLPLQTKIKLGDESLNLNVSAIYDHNKKYIGPMLTWEIITEKVTLVSALEETSSQLSSAAEELSANSTQMAKNADQTTEQSVSASASAEEVSQGVKSVATNTEEMTASIKEIAKASSDAAGISKEAKERATETNGTINQLGESSEEIGNVIKVISSIAQQTNLLALNATIEAARAGDAGKGFAVVANEVKELAKQTAKATEEITSKIASIQDSSKGAVDAIGGISEIIEKLNGISVSIAASVEEQAATTSEVSRVVAESNRGVENIAETVKTVSSAAEQSSAGAKQTLDAAKNLAELADRLKELVKSVEV